MPSLPGRIVLLLLAVPVLLGCTSVQPQGNSPLVPARMSQESVVLDIFFARFPFGDPQANGLLWEDLDEQHFPTELRRVLSENGFRVGLAEGQIPVPLSQLLQLSDKPPPSDRADGIPLADLEAEPTVRRRHLQLSNQGGMIVPSEAVHDSLTVLVCSSGRICGKTYPRAQPRLAVKAFPQADGRVRLDLVPELHYGESRLRPVADGGVLRLEAGQSREVFDKMTISATLSPGQMIVLAGLPDRPATLGHHFLSESSSGRLEQKLLVVRLSQTQHDDLFAAQSILPPDE